jgi:hypothetical protein
VNQPSHRRAYTEDAPPPAPVWTPFRAGWLVILVVAVAFRAFTLTQWSWVQDDFLFISDAADMGVVEYATQDVTGHVVPVPLLLTWLMTALAPLSYTWVVVTVCLLTALLVVAWGLALRELFGERLLILTLLLILSLNPGSTLVAHWWSSAMQVLPVQAAMGFCVFFLARYLRRGRRRSDLVGLNLSYAAGLLMWEKSLLITIPLFFVCLIVDDGPGDTRVRDVVRTLWPTAVLTAAYLVIYLVVTSGMQQVGSDGGYPRTLGSALDMLGHGTGDVLLPSLVGGPFGTPEYAFGTLPATGTALAWLLGLVAVGLVVLGVRVRRRGWLVLVMVLVHAAVTWGLVFASDRFSAFGAEILAAPRYSADLVPVTLLGLAFLCLPTVDEREPFRRRLPPRIVGPARRVGVAYAVLVCVLVAISSARVWNALEPTSTKPYVDRLVAGAKALGPATVYDTVTPDGVVNPVLFPETGRTSGVLAALDLPLTYDVPTDDFVMPDETGRFRRIAIEGPLNKRPGPVDNCGYLLLGQGDRERIALEGDLFPYQWVVEISYFAQEGARVRVTTDEDEVELDVPASPSGSATHRQMVVRGPVSAVTVERLDDSDEGVCVTEVHVGSAVPDPNG